MSNAPSPGPEVGTAEDLYRCLTTKAWWVAEEKRPSSAALKQPDFSTDVASLAGSPEYTLSRFPAGCGLISFNYGKARLIGFIARIEIDPEFPDNHAHANVCNPSNPSKRKTMAQKLVSECTVVREPTF